MNAQPTLITAIDALLPQTQCGKCGHPGCQPYAAGIAAGEAHNKCPPGGTATILELSALLQRPALPLDSPYPVTPSQRAVIREADCIGCTKCIQVCPTDAILGAAKLMHTVIESECSGCELCLAPCPVDCIDLVAVPAPVDRPAERRRAQYYRRRFDARQARLQRDRERLEAERQRRQVPPAVSTPAETPATADAALKPLKIAAAMARVALQKAERQLAQYGTPALEAQVQQLREAAEQAQVALDSAQRGAATARAPALATPATDPAALKQARIAATLARAQLTKAERAFGSAPTPEQSAQLAALRGAAQQAAHRLAALENPNSP
ncbi:MULTISPECIES: RnfABCDGE type electron transport complex subunit B [Pseudomonas]|uniref:(4Fe-4S)-binding protein n=1 Tax=Pseudomonas oryzihabitans TaxID=47885 RepID=A0ABX3IKD5_9PSED|nr:MULTISPECIES: RnfABCDGE type electron transport complex subunit B [Pseudomonas]MBH3328113.1 RnfABCDGE type electron transport complex subunit B [Pseudomonas oryzihabitans]NMZ46253.1 RnfABCDGE type electron transport complex subunit B [Pseudomonas oryzihabitans]ONN68787.1 (4Fe-4S)-binding protein [Pseudomonas psychrotolerans]